MEGSQAEKGGEVGRPTRQEKAFGGWAYGNCDQIGMAWGSCAREGER